MPDRLGGNSKVTANTRLPLFFGLAPFERPLQPNGPHTQFVLVGNGELGALRLMLAEKFHPPGCSCGNSCASLVVKPLLASIAYGLIAHPVEASKQSRVAPGLQLKKRGTWLVAYRYCHWDRRRYYWSCTTTVAARSLLLWCCYTSHLNDSSSLNHGLSN